MVFWILKGVTPSMYETLKKIESPRVCPLCLKYLQHSQVNFCRSKGVIIVLLDKLPHNNDITFTIKYEEK